MFARFIFYLRIPFADLIGHCGIGCAVNHDLTGLRNRTLGGRGLTIVFRNFRRRAAEELDHGIVAQVQLPGAPEIEDTGEGNRSRHRFLESRETERKMSSSGVSGDTDSPGIEI